MILTIELPDELEAHSKAKAHAQGVTAAGYARRFLECALAASGKELKPGQPLKTGRGLFAKYGSAPSAEEIDANRADMFRGSAQNFG